MAKIKNPIQFSEAYNVPHSKLLDLGILDPTLNVDSKLFVDPLLLITSQHSEMKKAEQTYKIFFTEVIKLLSVSKNQSDIAWRTACKKLLFKEIKGTCLGYGAASISGSGFGPVLTRRITQTAKEIVDLGITDPDLFITLPLLEEGVGPDLISDMTTNIILDDLIDLNKRILKILEIPTEKFFIAGKSVDLARNTTLSKRIPVILIPNDIIRDLPTASDWDSMCDAAAQNQALRSRVNRLIGEIWKVKTQKDKRLIRMNALASSKAFSTLLETIHEVQTEPYDLATDPEGIFAWRQIQETVTKKFPLQLSNPTTITIDTANNIVTQIIEQFQFLIEKKGLSKELWNNTKRRNEKSAQRIFFAVADSYCKANDLDINPEMDTGSGIIDFKFSRGYEIRVLVEIKLSDSSKVVSGYEKQLEAYKNSEKTTKGSYVVIDIGKMGEKDQKIIRIKNQRLAKGLPASEIFFINGTPPVSASKL